MSVVSYDGIWLPYAWGTQFRQEVVYDDSNTDWWLTRYDIEIQCTITADYLASIVFDLMNGANPPLPATDNPAAIMRVLQDRLKRPRRKLSFQFNGVDLIPNVPIEFLPGCVDARNGPIPQSCTFIEMNHSTFILSWRVVAHYRVTNSVNVFSSPANLVVSAPTSPVLYNRWSETVDIDNNNYTTRTRDGKFVIRSDNSAGQVADSFRNQLAVVGVPPGFLRQSSHYTIDPSGLGIQYRVIDKEIFKKPPSPAFTAKGVYVESAVTGTNGAMKQGTCRLHLTGAKDTPQHLLVQTATGVVFTKLKIQRPFVSMVNASLAIDMYENTVDAEITVLYQSTRNRLFGVPLIAAAALVATPAAPNQANNANGAAYTPVYTFRGTANILLRAASYFDINLTNFDQLANDAKLSSVVGDVVGGGVGGAVGLVGPVPVDVNAGINVGQPGTFGRTREPNS